MYICYTYIYIYIVIYIYIYIYVRLVNYMFMCILVTIYRYVHVWPIREREREETLISCYTVMGAHCMRVNIENAAPCIRISTPLLMLMLLNVRV